ncbi:MAG: HEAT repeat domain-containing protein [Planctomycetes bacterium]|nr:HEAT repeat domain-containing protein [Planctomycetota bacterium]
MTARRIATLVLLLAGASLPAGADVLVLEGGLTWVGVVEKEEGLYRIHTQGVVLEFPAESVVDYRPGVDEDDLYREATADLAEKDADAWFRAGLALARRGLAGLARRAYETCLARDADHRLAREQLGQIWDGKAWVSLDEYLAGKGFVREGGSWNLPGGDEAPAENGSAEPSDRIAELGLRLAEAVRAYRDTREAAARATLMAARDEASEELVRHLLRGPEPKARARAAAALGGAGELMALKPLVKSAVADASEEVRKASVEALLAIGYPQTPYYFEPALLHRNQAVRLAALEAVGRFANFPAIQVYVRTIHLRYGGGPRANIFVGSQSGYIRDYDVQVAPNATIADPVVGILSEGAVLDAKVLWIDEFITIEERVVVYGNLRRIAKVELPDDPKAWLAWWEENGARLEREFRKGA